MVNKVINQATGDNWTLINGDCIEVVAGLPDESISYSIFSPPFSSLYVYSNSERDIGNCRDYAEFSKHFSYLIGELFRVIKPGRLVSVHCMNLPTTKQHHGYIGIQDFRGDIIRDFEKAGFIYHSEVCIWKDPVTAMQRTKALGLLHKQVVKDSCMSRMGIPDYVCTFRKPGDNQEPVGGSLLHWAGDDSFVNNDRGREQYERDLKSYEHYLTLTDNKEKWEHADCGGITEPPVVTDYVRTGDTKLSIDIWQRYASPIWMDINPSRTLQYTTARETTQERHICPLQLDVIERCLQLWTNKGDTVLSPFAGIGSEGHVALKMGRRFVGIELKKSYYDVAARNLTVAEEQAKSESVTLFDEIEASA